MIFGTCLVVIKEVKEFFPQNFKMKCLEEAYIKLVREGDGGLVHLSPATCLAHTLFFSMFGSYSVPLHGRRS